MQKEYDALLANKTWCLIPKPSTARVITEKWVFRHKYSADGSFVRYKARWVVFTDTFGPVVKPQAPFALSWRSLPPAGGP